MLPGGGYATQQTMFALRTFLLIAISASVALAQDIDLRNVRRSFYEANVNTIVLVICNTDRFPSFRYHRIWEFSSILKLSWRSLSRNMVHGVRSPYQLDSAFHKTVRILSCYGRTQGRS